MDEIFKVGDRVYVPGEEVCGVVGDVERKIVYTIRLENGRTITRLEKYVVRDKSNRRTKRSNT